MRPFFRWVFWIAVIASTLVLVRHHVLDLPSSNPAPDVYRYEDAWRAATGFVAESLKAPSTARFPKMHEPKCGVAPFLDETWIARGYVDAQNSFGAQLRTDWEVIMEPAGNQWELVWLRLGNEQYGMRPKVE